MDSSSSNGISSSSSNGISSSSSLSSDSSNSLSSPSSLSSYGTRSSSSLTLQVLPSASSLSPSSESNVWSTSSASSSSQSGVTSAPSKLVLFRVARNENFSSYTVLVDLSELDATAVDFCGKPRIDPGGTFNGYVVRRQKLPIKDGLRMFLKIEPRQDLDEEDAIYQAWQQNVLSQLRAGVAFARQEAAILGVNDNHNYRAF